MRITWRSIEWLGEDYRARIEARLEGVAGSGGGADRVEITSRPAGAGSDACIEVRISGVIKKCQLTAVREHHAPERALNDALDAFERSVVYALQTRSEAAPASVGSPALAGEAAALEDSAFGFGRIGGSLEDVLRPLGSFVDRVSTGWASIASAPKRVLEARKPRAKQAAPKPKSRNRRGRGAQSSGMARQVAGGAAVVALVAGGLWWTRGFDQGLELPQVSLQPSIGLQAAVEEPVAYRAVAGATLAPVEASPPMFSAVARKTAGLSPRR